MITIMYGYYPLLLNGRDTNVKALVRTRLTRALAASNTWSCTEYNSNNSWNVNFGNGNTNNNNKYNDLIVRAVSALDDTDILQWIDAYDDCCKHKKTSNQCTLYRMQYEYDLLQLAREVKSRTYKPSTSVTFVVTRPKLREIFAANFRDRIVQHWISLRIEPLLECRFRQQGDVSFNCRKGYGVQKAVTRLYDIMSKQTNGFKSRAWIGKFDIKSFFMSIDVNVLWRYFELFIKENYKGDDMDTLLWLTKVTIFHQPQNDCVRHGKLSLWDKLPPYKSLFGLPYGTGMPIGNITSQLLANFYMSVFDEFILNELKPIGGDYIRFVDDFCIVCKDKKDIISLYKKSKVFAKKELHIDIHPNKFYLQPASHGVRFVGSILAPHRVYLSNATLGNLHRAVCETESLCRSIVVKGITRNRARMLDTIQSSVNSLLGFTRCNKSYGTKRRFFGKCVYLWNICYIRGAFNILTIRKNYKLGYCLYETNG